MESNVFSWGQLLWQIFNLLVLLAVFVFLWLRVARALKRPRPAEKASRLSETLGERLRRCRSECHMTQEFVAERLGVSRQAVSKWESNAAIPSTANLLALAKLFRVDAASLLADAKEAER